MVSVADAARAAHVVMWMPAIALFARDRLHLLVVVCVLRVGANAMHSFCELSGECRDAAEAAVGRFRDEFHSVWLSLAITHMSYQLDARRALVQSLALMVAFMGKKVFVSDRDAPWNGMIEYAVVAVVVPLNWRMSHQPFDYANPLTYAPLVVVTLGMACYVMVFQLDAEVAAVMWQTHLMAATSLAVALRVRVDAASSPSPSTAMSTMEFLESSSRGNLQQHPDGHAAWRPVLGEDDADVESTHAGRRAPPDE